MTVRIPFNKPAVVGSELEYVREAVAGGHASGDGPFTERAQAMLEERFGANRVLLTTSCTSALELAALLCDLQPMDEVIVPSYTFVSTANAFVLRGARPVFVDIRPDTLNIDERLIEQAITPRTRAIFPIHYAGVACEMDIIMDIADRHGLLVVEDAAQGVFARYKDRWLGTIGHLGCYSFHETKNISCGEGGALVINDSALENRAEILREKGTNRSQFIRGQADKYTWVDIGSSFLPSDMLAAFLVGQIENMEAITERRGRIFTRYATILEPLVERGLIQIPVVPSHCEANYHMFYLVTGSAEERTALIAHLRRAGILAVFHYVPLHTSPFARSLNLPNEELPETERLSARLLRLPMYFDLTDEQADEVAHHVLDFYGACRPSAVHRL
ncbi:dTDP-4-amino-4,6-dideoxygalactose transaminase [Mycolicibacterium novocastrense]|uniref:dTDP-4-amino-4,6-dideoxygalactose transaminase n=1 Tax=Mycolicibacterium novocastrense TaxID=59813 RepID=UPI000747B1B6|nr:dTDP-4-amino-4,6-dideoxygalactose transaminase [Mycolicibacterium novocastrense]KUH75773.1 dTDP-4-amino-4,6-dideoxygalactose transaminase [Mycolicibacterium novocastrense]KUH78334.1 dTDP-4-amino-4,6-dideoxygalactose transaminase [Mycolicibacterium novocastrense]KUH79669.1 dTDP-4-amino-4,6-dideoxygalactose transaminase [Mycolicibacterium novocastrense]